jgi:hypothetical protein
MLHLKSHIDRPRAKQKLALYDLIEKLGKKWYLKIFVTSCVMAMQSGMRKIFLLTVYCRRMSYVRLQEPHRTSGRSPMRGINAKWVEWECDWRTMDGNGCVLIVCSITESFWMYWGKSQNPRSGGRCLSNTHKESQPRSRETCGESGWLNGFQWWELHPYPPRSEWQEG